MSRILRDRLGELIRRSRLGVSGGAYLDQPEDTREEWRKSADRLLAESRQHHIRITDEDASQ